MTEGPGAGVPTCYRHTGRETYISCQRCSRPICPECMREAAVGFQCPECVREGARQTRSGLATYGGKRSANPQLTSMALIGINVFVWLLIMTTGGGSSPWVQRLALLPRGVCDGNDGFIYPRLDGSNCTALKPGADWVAGVDDGAWWQIVTSMFTHVQPWHIGANMLALWFLGPGLEALVGRARFLAIYLLGGLAGSALVYVAADPFSATLGASGAVFAVFGAYLVLAHKHRRDLTQLLMWIGLNFIITFTVPGISWQGHLGGFLGGAAIAAVIAYAPPKQRTLWQGLGLAVLLLALAAVFVARTVAL